MENETKKCEIKNKINELLSSEIWQDTKPAKTETKCSEQEDEEFGKFGTLMFGLWALVWLEIMSSYNFNWNNFPLNGWEFWISLFLIIPFASLICEFYHLIIRKNKN